MNKYLIQIISVIIISVPNFIMGFSISWPSYTLITLASDQSPLGVKITSSEGSLIGSMPVLGGIVATVLSGPITDRLGRKGVEILGGLCVTVSQLWIAVASTVTQLLVGRFINGIGGGLHGVICMVYIAEFCQPSIRGSLGSMTVFFYCSGSLVSFIMGWLCSYDVINYFALTLSVVFLVLLFFIKESPVYLLGRGREKEALKSFLFFRGVTDGDIPQEFVKEFAQLNSRKTVSELEKSEIPSENEKLQNQEKSPIQETSQTAETKKSAWKILFTSKSARAALVTVSVHMVLTALMGTVVVQTYAGTFFSKAAPDVSPHICSIALALVVAAGSGVSMLINDLIGRRVLMITTSALSAILLMTLASLLRWSWAPDWTVALVVMMLSFVFQLGPGCVPLVQLSECFSPQVKGLSMTISMCMMWLCYFVVLFAFGSAVEALGLDGSFFIFGVFGCLATVSSALIMKETRGVPLNEIVEMFENGYFCRYPNKKI